MICALKTCSKSFERGPMQSRKVYCSSECTDQAQKIRQRKPCTGICSIETCKKSFEFNGKGYRTYCSKACSDLAYKINQDAYNQSHRGHKRKPTGTIRKLCHGVICQGAREFLAKCKYDNRCDKCLAAVKGFPDNYSLGTGGRTCRS